MPRPAPFAERTPPAGDPEVREYLRQLAAALDARTAELGRRAARRPPPWALDRLGPVPADPRDRAGWSRRAGVVQAYREQYGYADPARPIGREPAAPEARAAWHAAAAALGTSPDGLGLAAATDGELHARRARYERELAWAPPHVGGQLRATALARREHQAEAVLTRARANTTDPGRRAAAEARAGRPRAPGRHPRPPAGTPRTDRRPARPLARRNRGSPRAGRPGNRRAAPPPPRRRPAPLPRPAPPRRPRARRAGRRRPRGRAPTAAAPGRPRARKPGPRPGGPSRPPRNWPPCRSRPARRASAPPARAGPGSSRRVGGRPSRQAATARRHRDDHARPGSVTP